MRRATFVALALLAVSSAFCPHKSPATPSLVRLHAESAELIAKDDGGQTPTDDEKAKIKTIKRNVVKDGAPADQKLHLRQFRLGIEGLFRRSNKLPYALFKSVRSGTAVSYMELDHVDFTDDINDTLFYQTVKGKDTLTGALNGVFKATPFSRPQAGTVDYEDLIGNDFFEPYERMMLADTPEDCFLQQAVAFCKPETPNSNRLVCDLSFMHKYQVNKNAAGRYGGKAVVQLKVNGKGYEIEEVDGRTSSSDDFERYKAKFLSSFGVYLIVLRHAVMTHLSISQRLLIKLTTKRNQKYIDTWMDEENKGPYTLLRALTTRTNEVSINEQLLIGPDRSLVQRATSFIPDSLELMLSDYYDKYSSMTHDELIADVADSGTGKWTIAVNLAWKGAKTVVNEICQPVLNKHVKQSDLDDMALMLWVSTFYHGFIGDFQLDNVNKGKLMLLHTGETEIPKKMGLSYGTLATTIGVSTMTRTIQCQTLGGFLPKKSEQEAWRKYMDLLASLDVGVEGFSLKTPVYAAVNF